MGCVAYLGSVLVISFQDLSNEGMPRFMVLAIGLMSMSSVVVTFLILFRDSPSVPKVAYNVIHVGK